MQLSRRKLIGGIGLLFAAPAIVKASSLMPVKPVVTEAEIRTLLAERQLAAMRAMAEALARDLYAVTGPQTIMLSPKQYEALTNQKYTWQPVGLSVLIDKTA